MTWEKIGRIFYVDKFSRWMWTHSALPIPEYLGDDIFRIYFSTRDQLNRSSVGFLHINIYKPTEILFVSIKPILFPGAQNSFDRDGVTLACIEENTDLIYYLGWNKEKNVPFSNQIGVAKKINSFAWEKIPENPIIKKDLIEPYSFGYPWVKKHQEKYIMWYDTNFKWPKNLNKYKFFLRTATSFDGISWNKSFKTCIKLNSNERSISRPFIINKDNYFEMWYSYDVQGKYKLGKAISFDLESWTRQDDQIGLSCSSSGWDSEELCYPFIFSHKNVRYLLYCGNSFGLTGFGLAKEKNNE